MKTLSEWQPVSRLRILAYGASKSGKTFGAATFPRPCFLLFDPDGLTTLTNPDFIAAHGYRPDILYEEFKERYFKGAVVSRHVAFDEATRFVDEMMKPENAKQFDTWVVDSGTTLSEAAEAKAIILLGTPDFNRMSQTHETAMKTGLVMPRRQDYGATRNLLEQFVDLLLATDKHVVLLCHEKEQRDQEGNLLAIVPNLIGQSAENIPLRFSEVYRIVAQRDATEYDQKTKRVTQHWRRVCRTVSDGLAKVGSRHGVPDGIPWRFESIAQAIVNNREALEARQREIAAQAGPAVVGEQTPVTLLT